METVCILFLYSIIFTTIIPFSTEHLNGISRVAMSDHHSDEMNIEYRTGIQQEILIENCPWSCECIEEYVRCIGDRWTTIPKIPLGTKQLIMQNGSFPKLYADSFIDKNSDNLTSLDMQYNRISCIESKPLLGLRNLLELNLSGNQLRRLHGNMLNDMSRLKDLDLSNNQLENLPSRTICKVRQLRSLRLGHNPFIRVQLNHTCLKASLTHLETLSLESVQFSHIDGVSFVSVQNSPITNLTLKNCNISLLRAGTFQYVRSITDLDLSYNNIQSLFNSFSLDLQNLKTLNLYRNKFKSIDFNQLHPLRSLDTLIIGNDELDYVNISFSPLAKNHNLSTLILHRGRFSTITQKTFRDFNASVNLKHLKILGCSIHTVEKGSFQYFHHLAGLVIVKTSVLNSSVSDIISGIDSNLEYFKLNYNYQIELTPDTFKVLKHPLAMRNLDLGYSHVTGFLPVDAIFILENLTILNLASNYVVDVKFGYSTRQLPSLKYLNLGHNAIKLVRLKFWKTFPNVIQLDLSFNMIPYFMMQTPNETDVEQLQVLSLQGNKLNRLKNLFVFKNLLFLNLENNELRNLNDSNFYGLHLLQTLKLAANLIESLPRQLFKNLQNLTELTLHNNYIYHLRTHTFIPLINLRLLGVAENHIELINVSTINALPSLRQLDLSANPLICSCKSIASLNLLMQREIYIPRLSRSSQVMCNMDMNLLDFHLSDQDCQPITEVLMIASVFVSSCFFMVLVSVCYRYRWYIRYKHYLLRAKLSRYQDSCSATKYKHDAFVSFSENDCEWVMDTLVEHVEADADIR